MLKGIKIQAILKAFVSAGCLIVIFYLIGKLDFLNRIPKEVAIYRNTPIQGSTVTDNGDILDIQFNAFSDFDRVCIPVYPNGEKVSLEVQLYSSVPELQNDIIFEYKDLLDSEQYPGWKEIVFSPNEVKGICEAGYYYLYFSNNGDSVNIALQDEENYYEAIPVIEGRGKINLGIYKASRLGRNLATIIYLVMFLLMYSLFYCKYTSRLTIKTFYICSAICLGIVSYMILFPAWSTNDATVHYIAANRYANILALEEADYEWGIRADDVEFWDNAWKVRTSHVYPDPCLEAYYPVLSGLKNKLFVEDITMAPSTIAEHMLFYKLICYWPLTFGILFGRLCHFNFIICAYLGRLFEGIVFLLLIWNAIRKIPVGKTIVALLSLMPVSLMYMTSYSYDGMVYCVCLNVIASILCLRFDDNAWNKTNMAECALWAFALGGVKGGGYIILIPLFCILLEKHIKSKRNIYVVVCMLMSVLSMVLFDVVLQRRTDEFFQFGTKGGTNYTTSFVFLHPIAYLEMLIRSWIEQADYWVFGAFGSNLGWDESIVPAAILMIMVIMIIICAVTEIIGLEKDLRLNRRDKICILLSMFLLLIFMPAMLMRNTPINSLVILGVQGRYYLPILPLLLILIVDCTINGLQKIMVANDVKETKTKEKKELYIQNFQNKLLICFGLFSCMIIYILMRVYLTR